MLFKKKIRLRYVYAYFSQKNPFTLLLRSRTSVRKRNVYGIRLRIPEYGSDRQFNGQKS